MFHLFFGVCCKCVCLDVAYVFEICFISVLSGCCLCFCNGFNCFSHVFASVSDACFKYFIWLQTYVASVACECFKSRSSIASPSSPSVASPQCLLLFSAPTGHPLPPPYLIDANDVQGDAGPAPPQTSPASRRGEGGGGCQPAPGGGGDTGARQ